MFDRVTGARDYLPAETAIRQQVIDRLRAWFDAHGYAGIELPVLEPTDLYVRKAGGPLLAKLYSFVEPGGARVSLRPEFTASAVRLYGEARPDGGAAHWQYAGPVFRFDPATPLRVWTQAGVEAIGSGGTAVDAGLLALATGGLREVGIEGGTLVLGHVGVFGEALAGFGLSDRTASTILGGLETLSDPGGAETMRSTLAELGLTATDPTATDLKQALQTLGDDGARIVVRGLLESINVDLLGGRHPDEIVGRLLRKLGGWDDPAAVERALQFAGDLALVRGPAREALSRARSLFDAAALAVPSLIDLEALVDALAAEGVLDVVVDFGLSRELGYYSGFVFDLRHPRDGGQSLCGGGRYDGLVRTLGGPDVPAAGFAYSVNALADLLSAPVAQATVEAR
ncbi:MAG: ATP phosphoribosyltransferase regulatory subunit [Dehalococcoidia bacterium]